MQRLDYDVQWLLTGKNCNFFLVLVVQLIIILLLFCVFFTVYAIILCMYSLIKE